MLKSSPDLFKSSVNLHEEILALEIEPEIKSKLLDCALNEKHIYLSEFIPLFKKHLSLNELKEVSTWLNSDYGKLWFNIHKGKADINNLPQNTIDKVNEFAGGKLMNKFNDSLVDSIKVANSAGVKFADYCSKKAGF
ncbi:hypothetical protein [Paraglaciecola sp. 25GB23A]|uniref:hypothetical protein n=1 Tax=Paraglaciecola sp. 25GB23A TaxID=3156068 RepID=UPI0032AFE36F